MTAQTRLSAKGQVVIPKDVRERLGLKVGTLFDVVERGGEVVLKAHSTARGLTAEEALREIRTVYRYDGPPVSLEEMDKAILKAVAEKHAGSKPK